MFKGTFLLLIFCFFEIKAVVMVSDVQSAVVVCCASGEQHAGSPQGTAASFPSGYLEVVSGQNGPALGSREAPNPSLEGSTDFREMNPSLQRRYQLVFKPTRLGTKRRS